MQKKLQGQAALEEKPHAQEEEMSKLRGKMVELRMKMNDLQGEIRTIDQILKTTSAKLAKVDNDQDARMDIMRESISLLLTIVTHVTDAKKEEVAAESNSHPQLDSL